MLETTVFLLHLDGKSEMEKVTQQACNAKSYPTKRPSKWQASFFGLKPTDAIPKKKYKVAKKTSRQRTIADVSGKSDIYRRYELILNQCSLVHRDIVYVCQGYAPWIASTHLESIHWTWTQIRFTFRITKQHNLGAHVHTNLFNRALER